jgi:hypothetical protein
MDNFFDHWHCWYFSSLVNPWLRPKASTQTQQDIFHKRIIPSLSNNYGNLQSLFEMKYSIIVIGFKWNSKDLNFRFIYEVLNKYDLHLLRINI